MGEFLKRRDSLRMKSREREEDMRLSSSKKRKVHSKIGVEYCSEEELMENSASPAASRTSSCSSHEGASDVFKKILRSQDLLNADSQSESFETEISTSTRIVFSRETTPTSQFNYGNSEHVAPLHLLSSKSKKNSSQPLTTLRQKNPNSGAVSMPSAVELESFFAAAEKHEQKRFAEKYNYDIVKDLPLEGKYQWVRLLP